MVLNPFDILGKWQLKSENSAELIAFMSDGWYRIYYEIPFRIIEVGKWKIDTYNLICSHSNIDIKSKITFLNSKQLELTYKIENQIKVINTYVKI